jgi:hypothetical protein
MTYAEIEAECAEIVATSRCVLPPHTRALFAAFIQHTKGLEVVERCYYCRGPLAVIEKGSNLDARRPTRARPAPIPDRSLFYREPSDFCGLRIR